MVSVFNLGSIRHLTIPSEWCTLPLERSNMPGQVTQPYALKDDEEVKFVLYYRGKEVAEDIASDFKAVLSRPPHKLSQAEYATIEVVIRHMSEDDFFERNLVETQIIDGKTVLVVEGLWKASAVKNLAVFVDGNGKGSLIDELHYYAPASKYDQHLAAGRKILASIKFVGGDKRS